MHELVRKLADEVDSLERSLRKINALHVNRREPRDAVRSMARSYFGEWRLSFVGRLGGEVELTRLDAAVQELVRMAQARTRVSEYRAVLQELKRAVHELELKSLRAIPSHINQEPILSHHQRILESLRKITESAANSFEQGLVDLLSGDRKSWRGTAVEFREALRETLDTLAPDDAVSTQPGFKLEPDAKGPTMKQKAVFILHARRPKDPQLKSFTFAIDVIEELIGKFVRSVYTRSSVAVHVAESKPEAVKVRDYVTLVLTELLEVPES
jgi:hypothetical protein